MKAGFTWIILPIIILLSFSQQLLLYGYSLMEKAGQSADLRERTLDKEEKQTEDNSRERGVEGQLRAPGRQGPPDQEDAEDPMVAPPDYEIRQSGSVLELQNRDLRLRPADMSKHLCGEVELVSGVHTLVAGVVQVYHRLQVVEEEEKGRKVEQKVERESQVEENAHLKMTMDGDGKTQT